jgi:single-strand DNA-binding protein
MSSLNFNQVTIAGHITEAPELRQTTSGRAVCTFTVAVNRRRAKDGTQAADFLTVVAWEKTAEFVVQYFPKGAAILVVGSIQTRKWQDKDGANRYATEIIANEAYFVDSRATITAAPYNPYAQVSPSDPAAQVPPSSKAPSYIPMGAVPTGGFEAIKGDDDLPF